MNRQRFFRGLPLAALLLALGIQLGGFAASAHAQGQYASLIPDHKVEIAVGGGYVWTFGRSAYLPPPGGNGSVDIKSSGYWDVALDFTLAGRGGPKVGQVELLFRQQPGTQLQFKTGGVIPYSEEMTVNYFQIGGLGGIPRGKAMPFGSFSLGATQYNFKDSTISDDWRFSMIFGLGVKYYASEKIGIRIQGNLPLTFFSSGAGVGCGFGGCGLSVGGTGIFQIDVGGALFLNFGT